MTRPLTFDEQDLGRDEVVFFNDPPHLPEPRWNGWFILTLWGNEADTAFGPYDTEALAAQEVRAGEGRVYDDATCCMGCA